ncbi:MAG: copper transporter [Bifidobacteriaceae bacterium]|jgi:hypothetical protein|nr:copper transporter [Bifidobacteriaceae bacterium]
MINFRYHLVSLVSVFVALAVGVVLGAGPLKEPFNTGLDDQVVQLRAEKDELRADLASARDGESYRDEVLAGLVNPAVDGLLTGRTLAILAIGSGAEGVVESVYQAADDAGARVSARVTIENAWWEGDAADLARAAGQVDDGYGAPSPTPGAEPDSETAVRDLAGLLAGALLPEPDEPGAGASWHTQPALPADSGEVLARLEAEGLISADTPIRPADALVFVVSESLARDAEEAAGESWQAEDAAVLGLVSEASRLAGASVVIGPAGSDRQLLAQVRDSDQITARASTVDGQTAPLIAILAVRAVAAELRGLHGDYGPIAAASGGQALPPRLSAALPTPTPTPTPTPADAPESEGDPTQADGGAPADGETQQDGGAQQDGETQQDGGAQQDADTQQNAGAPQDGDPLPDAGAPTASKAPTASGTRTEAGGP